MHNCELSLLAELHARPFGILWLRKCRNLPIRENLVITWPYTDRQPYRPSAPQDNQCFISHFLASLGAQEKTNCASMLRSIDSCQNRVSVDQYHLTVPWAQVSTKSRSSIFWSYRLTNYQFQMIADSSLFFPTIHIKYVVFMSLWPRTIRILISNWPRTRKFSQFFKNTGGEDLFLPWSRVGHALRPIFML